jgi:hypothetical protein
MVFNQAGLLMEGVALNMTIFNDPDAGIMEEVYLPHR